MDYEFSARQSPDNPEAVEIRHPDWDSYNDIPILSETEIPLREAEEFCRSLGQAIAAARKAHENGTARRVSEAIERALDASFGPARN